MKQIELLIHARWVIPVEPGDVFEHYSVAIDEGRIVAVCPTSDARQGFQAMQTLELQQHALIPGLINAHTHAAMTLLRGIADDLPLMQWLNAHIWPAERKWVNEQFIHDGTQLAVAEMLRGGTTCFNDMYFFPEVTARVAAGHHIRSSIGLILIDFPTAYAQDPDEYLAKGLNLHDEYRHHPLVRCAFAPHAPYTVSDRSLQRVQVLSDELDLQVHIHLHESADEISRAVGDTGVRPLQRLQGLGLVSPALTAVHMTQLEDAERTLLAENGASVVHCPESNLKLASGFCQVQKLLDGGINVALGTDGTASNNDLDMFGEMRTAALIGKVIQDDASAMPAHSVLKMATLNGARALGMADSVGSIETGKWADLAAIDLGSVETQPVYDPVSALVYSAGREQVSDVWVAGQQVLKQRQLVNMDIDELLTRVHGWQTRIARGDHANS